MGEELFDVFVVGATDQSPGGHERLAAALATRHRAPAAAVAQAITQRSLRAGNGLSRDQAAELGRQLQAIGAVVAVRDVFSGGSTRAMGSPVAPDAPGRAQRGAGPPSLARDPFAPPDTQSVGEPMVGRDPFGPTGATGATGATDATDATEAGIELELDTGDRPAADSSLPGASGMRSMGLATKSTSGLAASGEDQLHAHSVKCVTHGLYYDKRRASGCRKCMASARHVAGTIEQRFTKVKLEGLRDDPVRRACLGLALALIIGLLPAAYSALRLGAGDVARLRAEQEELSRRVGTEEVLARFDEIDLEVGTARTKSMRNTIIVWVAVSGIAMAGWYKVT